MLPPGIAGIPFFGIGPEVTLPAKTDQVMFYVFIT
jgi:hypothetical protein